MANADVDSFGETKPMVDLESGNNNLNDDGSYDSNKDSVSSQLNHSNNGTELSDMEKKKKKKGTKKPPKPPRPPRAPSMDAADQKFVREITELATLKRARVERMKALKRMKNARSTNSKSNVIAFVVTVVFCIVIIWQGFFPNGEPGVSFQGSPESSRKAKGGFISVQLYKNRVFNSASPNKVEIASGLDGQREARRE